jgi:hypothetical protein
MAGEFSILDCGIFDWLRDRQGLRMLQFRRY